MKTSIIAAGLLLALATQSHAQQPNGTNEKSAAPAPRPVAQSSISRTTVDGPADVLNGFVLKEIAQCRPLASSERRSCCERLLPPAACAE